MLCRRLHTHLIEHLWEILEKGVRQHAPPSSLKHQLNEFLEKKKPKKHVHPVSAAPETMMH